MFTIQKIISVILKQVKPGDLHLMTAQNASGYDDHHKADLKCRTVAGGLGKPASEESIVAKIPSRLISIPNRFPKNSTIPVSNRNFKIQSY